jgi:two-component sensor histidine kinase
MPPLSWEGSSALVWDAERLRIATDAAGVALWSWNVDTDEIAMDERAHGLWGVPRNGPVTFEDLSARIHPEDRNRVRAAFTATRKALGTYDLDFRILLGDEIRWVSARGQGADLGIVGRVMFGVFLDVTERKRTEEVREMLAGEMSHRIKNLFAIASALTAIAARSAATTTEMARDLTQRLTALGRAHDLVRPIPGQEEKAALLGDLIAVLLAPYDHKGAVGDRIHVSVPDVHVGEATATTLALVVHELATNSIKYGALSVAAGALDVSCTDDNGEVVIIWTERGGPPVVAPTGPEGFGSRLVAQSISGQLGGSIAFAWPTEGVIATLRMSKARLAT